MERVGDKLPFPEELQNALLGEANFHFYVLNIVRAYESGSWWNLQKACQYLNISDEQLPEFHAAAIVWADMYKDKAF